MRHAPAPVVPAAAAALLACALLAGCGDAPPAADPPAPSPPATAAPPPPAAPAPRPLPAGLRLDVPFVVVADEAPTPGLRMLRLHLFQPLEPSAAHLHDALHAAGLAPVAGSLRDVLPQPGVRTGRYAGAGVDVSATLAELPAGAAGGDAGQGPARVFVDLRVSSAPGASADGG
jgi:hypothetical protein